MYVQHSHYKNQILQFHLDISQDINPEEIEVPPLLFQPHLENAILHGIPKADQPEISLTISIDNQALVIIIQDNGPGFDAILSESKGLGLGWEMTRQRIELLKPAGGDQLSVSYTNRTDKSGMIVTFRLQIQ